MNDEKEKTEFVPETPEWAEEEQTNNSWNIPGITTIPCAKYALMNGIGASFVAGIGYNLAFSKRPTFVVPIVMLTVHIGSWFSCRYNYWKTKIENQRMGYAMSSYHYLRGTEDDAKRDQEFLDKIDREGARAPRIRQVKTTSDISSD